MGIFNKIKDMFFEETEDDVVINDNRIAQKIELPASSKKEEVMIKDEEFDDMLEDIAPINEREENIEDKVTFEAEDFVEDFIPKEEEKEHVLYGGVQKKEEIREKKRFEPSPVISPVYGVLSKNYNHEAPIAKKDLDHLFVDQRKKKITFDSVRQKAYGDLTEEIDATSIKIAPKEEKELLYDMAEDTKGPAVEKVTVGDADDYFKDLGLEYNVDYIDNSKGTRSERNKELMDEVESVPVINKNDDEEKNLYDLIDMMYENKEE